mmetsp:Transcript_25011/g.52238  ORF Transcript_25011/g.52238 Transcript_25011/m.52238 type:complete len:1454 (+) Transcript_25011:54-4415(+)
MTLSRILLWRHHGQQRFFDSVSNNGRQHYGSVCRLRERIRINLASRRHFLPGTNQMKIALSNSDCVRSHWPCINTNIDTKLFFATDGSNGALFNDSGIDKTEFPLIYASKSNGHLLHVPIKFLDDILRNEAKSSDKSIFDENSFEIIETTLDGKRWFSATFIHPFSNENFESGKGRELGIEKKDGATMKVAIYDSPVEFSNDRVYYPSTKLAKNAAVARYIDCSMFREENKAIDLGISGIIPSPKIRLCVEEPYLAAEDGESRKVHSFDMGRKNNDSLDTLSSMAKSHPHLLLSPIEMVDRFFPKLSREQYTTQVLEISGNEYYTATFIHPETNEKFSSGIGRELKLESHKGRLIPPLHLSHVEVIDGKVCYTSASRASHAAAARFIDCMILRECQNREKYDADFANLRLCLEDPYMDEAQGNSQVVNYDDLLKSHHKHKGFKFWTNICLDKPHLLLRCRLTLRNFLHYKYDGFSSFLDAYDTKSLGDNNEWFTSTFSHSILNEAFDSGLFAKFPQVYHKSKFPPLHSHDVRVVDCKVYYKDPVVAEFAAAARAIDCLMHRELNDVEIPEAPEINFYKKYQLCLEDPYVDIEERESQKIDYDALLAKRKLFEESATLDVVAAVDNIWGNGEDDEISSESGYLAGDYKNDSFQDDDDEFTIEVVSSPTTPFSKDFAVGGSKCSVTTMDRIVEIWTDSTLPDTSIAIENSDSAEERIKSILAWYKRVDRNPGTRDEASGLAQLCTKILIALGNANKQSDIDLIDVRADATEILEKIVSLSSKFAKSQDSSFLSTEALNAYMRCLNQSDPSASAKIADDFLRGMSSNDLYKGVVLPSPDLNTYNTVMSLWSVVGGDESQVGVNNVYQRLEVASLGEGNGTHLRPNSQTFKILLGTNSRKDNRFCIENAKEWMEKIKTLLEELGDKEMLSDVDIYNAAVSRQDNKIISNDNEYSPYWLSLGKSFDGGFKNITDDGSEKGMEEWLLDMETKQVYPTIETYEAVIQAWIETGTWDGLLRAEDWAKRSVLSATVGLQSSVIPRLKTIKPIIAAWALCGDERAPKRVKDWIDQLTMLSETTLPHLRPGLDIFAAQVVAWRQHQISKMKELETPAEHIPRDDLSAIFSAAQNCSDSLGEIIGKIERHTNTRDVNSYTTMFTNVIQAWGAASISAVPLSSESDPLAPSRGVNQILKTIHLLESIAALPDRTFFDDDVNELQSIEIEQSREHKAFLFECLGEVFAEALEQLRQIDTSVREKKVSDETRPGKSFFLENVFEVEKMLRYYESQSRIVLTQDDPTSFDIGRCCELYKKVLRGCMGVTCSHDYGHVVRISSSIMDFVSWRNDQFLTSEAKRAQTNDITDLYCDIACLVGKVVLNHHEKQMALTEVFNRASQFFNQSHGEKTSSAFATVDKAALIGAIRLAVEGSFDDATTESFIGLFDSPERHPKRRTKSSRRSGKPQ